MGTTFLNKTRMLVFVALITAIACFCLSGCNVYAGKYPGDYGVADWICEDPEIVLHIQPDRRTKLELRDCNLDGTFSSCFSFGGELIIYREQEGTQEELLCGKCHFGSKQMKVVITQDDLYGGQYLGKTIVFTRYEITAE